MNTENFGKKILSIRQNANLTQEELALRIGVTPQAISKWEREVYIVKDMVLNLAMPRLYIACFDKVILRTSLN